MLWGNKAEIIGVLEIGIELGIGLLLLLVPQTRTVGLRVGHSLVA